MEVSKPLHDSPLTTRGTPRKRKYPRFRKKRDIDGYNTEKTMKFARIKKESQIKLLTFAPMYTNIYTLAYGSSDTSRYFYVDVFSVFDGRLYKITKMVAKILGYNIIPSHHRFRTPNVMQVPNYLKEDKARERGFLEVEHMVVANLSMAMFNIDNGYFHESIMELFPYEAEKKVKMKDYRVRRP